MKHGRRKPMLLTCLALLLGLYIILLIPERPPPPVAPATRAPFVWRQDDLWRDLESRFVTARNAGEAAVEAPLRIALTEADTMLDELAHSRVDVEDHRLDALETKLFELAPMAAVCPRQLGAFLDFTNRLRRTVKDLSASWEMESDAVRARLYRLLYGNRAALEEAMLQAPADALPKLSVCDDEPSTTPAVSIQGVRVHSGDILASRGAAPTSALIARGSDFPGNFSHIALVHVDAATAKVSVVEALIEKGVVVNAAGAYLGDPKLRVMLLRPRADLPRMQTDPWLAHHAAERALADATSRKIRYDFAMDAEDHSRLFCAEVASAAYKEAGIELWRGRSRISSPGLASWLAAFGVRHFDTQEPTDLEYDPQLRVVAEWRDTEALFADHVDNAVTDALIETAEAGAPLSFAWYLLPVARLLKLYSAALLLVDRAGPIPEGMSATAALKHTQFSELHGALKAKVMARAAQFQAARGYRPPYWELIRFARDSLRPVDAPL